MRVKGAAHEHPNRRARPGAASPATWRAYPPSAASASCAEADQPRHLAGRRRHAEHQHSAACCCRASMRDMHRCPHLNAASHVQFVHVPRSATLVASNKRSKAMKDYCHARRDKPLQPKITAKELVDMFNSNSKTVGMVMKSKGIIGFVSGRGGTCGMNTNYPKRQAIEAMTEYFANKGAS